MLITKEWLEQFKTKSGGYTKAQIIALGMEWPPVRGWKTRILGMDISESDAGIFETSSCDNDGGSDPVARLSPIDLCIWTDGACVPNPGRGGWGWVDSLGKEDCGGEKRTTNNRMEMTAIYQALINLPDKKSVTVYSDSQYCVNGLTVWRKGWKRNNWNKAGKPMLNRDLWLELEGQLERVEAKFVWVRGHSGNSGNERADRLSVMGIRKA